MGKYKFFDEIIKCEDVFSILRKLTDENEKLCLDLIKILVKGIDNWQMDYIFRPDLEQYAKAVTDGKKIHGSEYVPKYISNMTIKIEEYDKKIFQGYEFNNLVSIIDTTKPEDFAVKIIEEINSRGYERDSNIKDLSKYVDFAAITKIIQYRLCKDDKIFKISKDNDLIGFIIHLREIRNLVSHKKGSITKEEGEELLNKTDKLLKTVIDKVEDNVTKPDEIKIK